MREAWRPAAREKTIAVTGTSSVIMQEEAMARAIVKKLSSKMKKGETHKISR